MIYYICNRKNKVEHCYEHCYHGKPHEADSCTGDEICYIGIKKGVVVKCRPATKEELEKYGKEKEQESKKSIGPWSR